MGIKEKLEEKIHKKDLEIQELELKIREARSYIQALQETIKVLPREATSESQENEVTIRQGSTVYKTLKFLESSGKPLHINDILQGIGKSLTKSDKTSLSGSLGWYVRKNLTFTRPAPNTFGLKIWESKKIEVPPELFGLPKE